MTPHYIVKAIRQFQKNCEAEEYTDTERAHELLGEAHAALSEDRTVAYVLEIIDSARDVNGNTYTIAKVISTRTGRHAWFNAHSAGNARHAVMQHCGPGEVYYIEQSIPIREFNRIAKPVELLEDQITAGVLSKLDGR